MYSKYSCWGTASITNRYELSCIQPASHSGHQRDHTFTKFSCSTRSGKIRKSLAWPTDNVLARLNVMCNIINCIMHTEWVTFFVSFCSKEDVTSSCSHNVILTTHYVKLLCWKSFILMMSLS